jgi:hypothetical protein
MDQEPIAGASSPTSRHLVFTSAGDRSNLRSWLRGRRDFDLWVVYYGDRPGTFREESQFYLSRKGAKFQNLHHCYERFGHLIAHYDAVMVLDDDIVIDATAISRLFDIRRQFGLWALQPAFRPRGKISWDITRVRPTAKLRYTNFIEMTCPLFRRDKLDAFMAVFDPELVGYGEDWWFLKTLGRDLACHVAIVDEITCVNPHDRSKGGAREIDRISSKSEREAVWERVKQRHGLDEGGRRQEEYGRVDRSALAAMTGLIADSADRAYVRGRGLAGRLVRTIRHAE